MKGEYRLRGTDAGLGVAVGLGVAALAVGVPLLFCAGNASGVALAVNGVALGGEVVGFLSCAGAEGGGERDVVVWMIWVGSVALFGESACGGETRIGFIGAMRLEGGCVVFLKSCESLCVALNVVCWPVGVCWTTGVCGVKGDTEVGSSLSTGRGAKVVEGAVDS